MPVAKRIDLPQAFEFYCENAGIKGGANGPTAKRWRPKIAAFCEFGGLFPVYCLRVITCDAKRL